MDETGAARREKGGEKGGEKGAAGAASTGRSGAYLYARGRRPDDLGRERSVDGGITADGLGSGRSAARGRPDTGSGSGREGIVFLRHRRL